METLGYSPSETEAQKVSQNTEQIDAYSNPVRKTFNFIRVAPYPLAMATLCLAVAAGGTARLIEDSSRYGQNLDIPLFLITAFNLAIAGRGVAVAKGKNDEYKKVREALTNYGWDERIIEPKSYSWCQRHAARRAAIETGHKKEIDRYYSKLGYKWYSII